MIELTVAQVIGWSLTVLLFLIGQAIFQFRFLQKHVGDKFDDHATTFEKKIDHFETKILGKFDELRDALEGGLRKHANLEGRFQGYAENLHKLESRLSDVERSLRDK